MSLELKPPILPMLAKRIDAIPAEGDWIFEPKWDGFRCLVFQDSEGTFIQSRDGKSLNRYFPELLEQFKSQLPVQCVLDGEIVISRDGSLDFDALQLRIHPALSRIKLLALQTPASVVFFDLLWDATGDVREQSFVQRRSALQRILSDAKPPIHITPATSSKETATDWFRRFEGAGLDGVIAKSTLGLYESGKRTMLKVKHERECDCVVAGFRWHKDGAGTAVGSLLLGLFDDAGVLQHVGVCASFTKQKRSELVEFLTPYRQGALIDHPWAAKVGADSTANGGEHRMPGGQSRWSQGKDLSWEPLRVELVLEVAYEHMQGSRFRHMAQFRRWRIDKTPVDCTYTQLEVVPPQELAQIFHSGR